MILLLSGCDPDLSIVTPVVNGADGGASAVGPAPSPLGDAAGAIGPGDGISDGGPADAAGPTTIGHVIDGVNDFAPTETFTTSSTKTDVYQGFIAWDEQRLYFGMSGKDVGSKSTSKWVHVYLGVPGASSTRTGIEYGGVQQPTLPFDATHHLRWKTSGDFSSVEVFQAGAWKTASAALVPFTVKAQGTFVEMSVTRASIGATGGSLAVHMNMLIEGGGNDWTYAGVPSTSFVDGNDPNFGRYFEFDLNDTVKAPNSYTPK